MYVLGKLRLTPWKQRYECRPWNGSNSILEAGRFTGLWQRMEMANQFDHKSKQEVCWTEFQNNANVIKPITSQQRLRRRPHSIASFGIGRWRKNETTREHCKKQAVKIVNVIDNGPWTRRQQNDRNFVGKKKFIVVAFQNVRSTNSQGR